MAEIVAMKNGIAVYDAASVANGKNRHEWAGRQTQTEKHGAS